MRKKSPMSDASLDCPPQRAGTLLPRGVLLFFWTVFIFPSETRGRVLVRLLCHSCALSSRLARFCTSPDGEIGPERQVLTTRRRGETRSSLSTQPSRAPIELRVQERQILQRSRNPRDYHLLAFSTGSTLSRPGPLSSTIRNIRQSLLSHSSLQHHVQLHPTRIRLWPSSVHRFRVVQELHHDTQALPAPGYAL